MGAGSARKTLFCFLVVILGLSPNSVLLLYYPRDNYKQKQWNSAGNDDQGNNCSHFNRLLWWLPWHWRLVLVFGDLD